MPLTETVDLDACSERDLDGLSARIAAGAVVVFPTDTVYGIGCSAAQVDAVARVFSIKRRRPDKPLPVFTSGIDSILRWIDPAERAVAMRLATRFWSGPLTIVVDVTESGLHTQPPPYPEASAIGFRAPGQSGLLRLLRHGLLMAETSLNESGNEAIQWLDAPDAAVLIQQADVVLRSRQRPLGRPSTVVRVAKGSWSFLREGVISEADVQAVLLEEPGDT